MIECKRGFWYTEGKKITVIGPAIIDVLAFPVSLLNMEAGSQPMEDIKLSYGGGAVKEAVISAVRILPGFSLIRLNIRSIESTSSIGEMKIPAKLTISAAVSITASGVGCAVIKCGKKGCIIQTKDKCTEIPAFPVAKVADSTGAGDSFVAGFLYGLSRGFSVLLPDLLLYLMLRYA